MSNKKISRPLSRVLRDYRERAGFSQHKLSIISNVQQTSISNIETGRRKNPYIKTLIDIAVALELTPYEVIDLLGINIFPHKFDSTLKSVSKRYSFSESLNEDKSFDPE